MKKFLTDELCMFNGDDNAYVNYNAECKIIQVGSHNKYKIEILETGERVWVVGDELRLKYKFREGDTVFKRTSEGYFIESVILKVLIENETYDYIIKENSGEYSLVLEEELTTAKKLDDLSEGDKIYLKNREVKVLQVVWDDLKGETVFLLKWDNGLIDLLDYEELYNKI